MGDFEAKVSDRLENVVKLFNLLNTPFIKKIEWYEKVQKILFRPVFINGNGF